MPGHQITGEARATASPLVAAAAARAGLSATVRPLCCPSSHRGTEEAQTWARCPELDAEIAAIAERAGMGYSAWLADTARMEFTIRAALAEGSRFEADRGHSPPATSSEAGQRAATAAQRASRTTSGAAPRGRHVRHRRTSPPIGRNAAYGPVTAPCRYESREIHPLTVRIFPRFRSLVDYRLRRLP